MNLLVVWFASCSQGWGGGTSAPQLRPAGTVMRDEACGWFRHSHEGRGLRLVLSRLTRHKSCSCSTTATPGGAACTAHRACYRVAVACSQQVGMQAMAGQGDRLATWQ